MTTWKAVDQWSILIRVVYGELKASFTVTLVVKIVSKFINANSFPYRKLDLPEITTIYVDAQDERSLELD